MNWNKFDEVVPPEKDRLCWVYKPNNRFCKFAVDEWVDLYESPVSWSTATICVGEGWADEDDMDNITHWCYCEEPSATVTLGTEPTLLGKLFEEPE